MKSALPALRTTFPITVDYISHEDPAQSDSFLSRGKLRGRQPEGKCAGVGDELLSGFYKEERTDGQTDGRFCHFPYAPFSVP